MFMSNVMAMASVVWNMVKGQWMVVFYECCFRIGYLIYTLVVFIQYTSIIALLYTSIVVLYASMLVLCSSIIMLLKLKDQKSRRDS